MEPEGFVWGLPCGIRKEEKERNVMSNKSSNSINVPQAKEAMDKFKQQAAQDEGVPGTY